MSKNNKEVIINFRLTKELNKWLSEEAKRNQRSKSGQLQHMVIMQSQNCHNPN